jgi:hypothetical protein
LVAAEDGVAVSRQRRQPVEMLVEQIARAAQRQPAVRRRGFLLMPRWKGRRHGRGLCDKAAESASQNLANVTEPEWRTVVAGSPCYELILNL